MGECGGRGRIRKIISRHIHSLYGGNGPLVGGGNALLQGTHIGGKRGLVPHSGRDAPKKSRHLRASLSEAEDIVDEKQHILSLLVSEVLGNGQTSKGHTSPGSWGLIHLAVHKGSLGSLSASFRDLDDTSLNHLVVQIVTLSGTFTDASKHRVPSVVLSNVVDELHDDHGLAHTSTTKQTNLSSLGVGGQQVHHLDTGHQNLLGLTLLCKKRGCVMDGSLVFGFNWPPFVYRLADDIHNTTKGFWAHGNHNGFSSIIAALATNETLSTVHSNGSYNVLAQMLGNF
mmetsp:Transcript_22005/g.31929  ORF Transcript_22005/g.31929 Transcript_22005/m.31929 type:complete len:285 (+) Transcript_22005:634-1488(+)